MQDNILIKVGGAVLRDGKSYINAAEHIKSKVIDEGKSAIVVVSAMKGITDELIKGCEGSMSALHAVIETHIDVARYIGGYSLEKKIMERLKKLQIMFKLGKVDDVRIRNLMLSYGERLSKLLFTEALLCVGIKAIGLDAAELIKTNSNFGDAIINYDQTSIKLRSIIPTLLSEGFICVIEGFIGTDNLGNVTILGRGGSDYTATTIASLLGINEVYLITDVPGIMTADPKYVPSAKVITKMSYDEALEASLYGGKNLHPRTFHPLINYYSSTIKIGTWENIGTTIVKESDEEEDAKLKLVTFKPFNKYIYVAIIGRGIHKHNIIIEILDSIVKSDINFEGYLTFRNRPSIIFLFKNDMFEIGKILNLLHGFVVRC